MMPNAACSSLLAILLAAGVASGCAPSHLASATRSIERNDYARAVADLELGAAKGDRRCAYLLGSILLSGQGVDQNLVEGARWMREAAEAELPVAQTYLGTLYANGEGVVQDPSEAVGWYRKAAEYGDPVGQAALGAAVFHGIGVVADPVEGYKWTKLAAGEGVEKAISNLPEMLASLTESELKRAERQVAKFQPKENSGSNPNWSINRPTRASINFRRARDAGAIRAATGL